MRGKGCKPSKCKADAKKKYLLKAHFAESVAISNTLKALLPIFTIFERYLKDALLNHSKLNSLNNTSCIESDL